MQGGQRLWIIVVAIAVLAVALAGGGWWWLSHGKKTAVAGERPHLIGALGDTARQLDATLPDKDKLCSATLARALDFGALPPGASLVSAEAKAEQPEGRFSCQAKADDGQYTLSIDASCPNSQEKTCFALDSIRRQDGTFTYRRKI